PNPTTVRSVKGSSQMNIRNATAPEMSGPPSSTSRSHASHPSSAAGISAPTLRARPRARSSGPVTGGLSPLLVGGVAALDRVQDRQHDHGADDRADEAGGSDLEVA